MIGGFYFPVSEEKSVSIILKKMSLRKDSCLQALTFSPQKMEVLLIYFL